MMQLLKQPTREPKETLIFNLMFLYINKLIRILSGLVNQYQKIRK